MTDWRREKRRERWAARNDSSSTLDGSTFQRQLEDLAVTMINQLEREGHRTFGISYLNADLAMMLRQLTYTYDLLFFVNADEKRSGEDPGYRLGYSFVILPLVRTMIDCFYNVTSLLDDPSKAKLFRLSGYKHLMAALDEDEFYYGHEAKWAHYVTEKRDEHRTDYRRVGFSDKEVGTSRNWQLLGAYLRSEPKNTPHKQLLRRFAFGFWQEYSAISHATYQGLKEISHYINLDNHSPELRMKIEGNGDLLTAMHLSRAAGLLLATITEIQVVYMFSDHHINARILTVWQALLSVFGIKEIFEYRYRDLLSTRLKLKV